MPSRCYHNKNKHRTNDGDGGAGLAKGSGLPPLLRFGPSFCLRSSSIASTAGHSGSAIMIKCPVNSWQLAAVVEHHHHHYRHHHHSYTM
ncbi:hypothetical protein ACLKA7_013202 [Drosophila subpalustris]